MTWKIHVLRTSEEQAQGVKLFPAPLNYSYLVLFPWIAKPGWITMDGVQEPLHVYAVDSDFQVIFESRLDPGDKLPVQDDRIKHVIETSAESPELGFLDLRALSKYL
jgi:hypothetical protein